MATEKVGVYRKYHGAVPIDKLGQPLPKSEWSRERPFRWVVRWVGSDGKRLSRSFKSRKEADRYAETKQAEVRMGKGDQPRVVTVLEYDEVNRLKSKTIDPDESDERDDELAPTTIYDYNEDGRLKKVTAPDGAVTEYKYDTRRRLDEVVDAEGGVTKYGYDAENRLTSFRDAEGRTTRYDYDLTERTIQVINPLGTKDDPSIPEDGRTRTFIYDENYNLEKVSLPKTRSEGIAAFR